MIFKIIRLRKYLTIIPAVAAVFLVFGVSTSAQTTNTCAVPCTTGYICSSVNGQCIPDPNAPGQTSGGLGASGASCSTPATCQPGLSCINGVCAAPAGSGPVTGFPTNLSIPAPCPAGLTQVNGLCLPPSQCTGGLCSSTTLADLLVKIIQILLTFAGIVAVVMLVLGGYWYMASGGNEEMAEKGRKTVINFVLGLVFIIMAYTIVSVLAGAITGNTGLGGL